MRVTSVQTTPKMTRERVGASPSRAIRKTATAAASTTMTDTTSRTTSRCVSVMLLPALRPLAALEGAARDVLDGAAEEQHDEREPQRREGGAPHAGAERHAEAGGDPDRRGRGEALHAARGGELEDDAATDEADASDDPLDGPAHRVGIERLHRRRQLHHDDGDEARADRNEPVRAHARGLA